MSTLLLIHSNFGHSSKMLSVFWNGYTLPGWDILGIDPEGDRYDWPHGTPHVNVPARRGYFSPGSPHLCQKLIETFAVALQQPGDYTDFCVIEWDGIFIRKPQPHHGGFMANRAGGYNNHLFYHTPWWADRKTAEQIVESGRAMIKAGDICNGSPDMFIGKLVHDQNIQCTNAHTWSMNGGSLSGRTAVPSARGRIEQAIKAGVWYVHCLRTQEEYEWVQSLL